MTRGVSGEDRRDPVIHLEDAPYILGGVAELAAGNAGTQVKLADSNGVILDLVSKVVVSLRHGSDENSNALLLVETRDVVADADDFGIKT